MAGSAITAARLSALLGAQWIMGGFHDAVLVVGAEQQKTMSSLDGSDVIRGGGSGCDVNVRSAKGLASPA